MKDVQRVVPMEEMYRKKRGVPPIVGGPWVGTEPGKISIRDIRKRINASPSFEWLVDNFSEFGKFELSPGEPEKIIAELCKADVLIEKRAREEILSSVSFSKVRFTRAKVSLVEITAPMLSLDENASHEKVLYAAVLCGLLPCVDRIPFLITHYFAKQRIVPKDPYVVFSRYPQAITGVEDPVLFTMEITSRTWGGVTLGAVNGTLDFVAPGRKYIFVKEYTQF